VDLFGDCVTRRLLFFARMMMDDCMRVANSGQFYARFHLTQLGRTTKCCAQYQTEQVVRIEKDSDCRKSTLQNMVGGSVILDESTPACRVSVLSRFARHFERHRNGALLLRTARGWCAAKEFSHAFLCERKPSPTMLGAAMRSRRQSSSGFAITNLSG
jgi:hypothetical protein